MTQPTISGPRFEADRRQYPGARADHRRFGQIAILLSLCVHLAVALLVALLPRFLPRDARPQEQGTIEFVLREQQGAEPGKAGQPFDAKPISAEKVEPLQAEAKKNETQTPPSQSRAESMVANPDEEPVPPPIEQIPPEVTKADPQAAKHPAEAQSLPPPTQDPPVVNFRDAKGEFDAIFSGNHIIPATLDGRFRNQPPAYPEEAAMKAQHGSVGVMIHVGSNGLVTGVDVVEKSSVAALDQAAVAAARRWRFHPAIKAGRATPFDLPFRFIFEDN